MTGEESLVKNVFRRPFVASRSKASANEVRIFSFLDWVILAPNDLGGNFRLQSDLIPLKGGGRS